ncbi:MAG: hypothetical protein GY763_04365 [Gammaproteobacteria bacterium]|nr:hypothetical protein [Gammaproteobacteria bacterium]
MGHTITLFLFGATVLLIDQIIPVQLAQTLELIVGAMLILFGIDVLWRAYKNRIHYHLHKHNNEKAHFHVHSHAGEGEHTRSEHKHQHAGEFPTACLVETPDLVT